MEIPKELIELELKIIEAFLQANPHFNVPPPYSPEWQERYNRAYEIFRSTFLKPK